MGFKIGIIRGDGVGPEIVSSALKVLEEIEFNAEYIEVEAGLELYKKSGRAIEDGGLEKLSECDATLKGPIATLPGPGTYQSINVLLRKHFNLYVNFRPFVNIINNKFPYFDFVILRENTEELYSGIEWSTKDFSIALRIISRAATEKIVRYAFNYAVKNNRKRVTVVHKANILKETDGLFRAIFFEESKKYSSLKVDEVIVDAAAYQLVKNPESFDVLVTPNLYGDILSDLAAGLVGSLGLCGSANIGENYAVFEPVHGAAFDIAKKGIANPVGMILSTSYMLKWLGERKDEEKTRKLGEILEVATGKVLKAGNLTVELGGSLKTSELVGLIIKEAKNLKEVS